MPSSGRIDKDPVNMGRGNRNDAMSFKIVPSSRMTFASMANDKNVFGAMYCSYMYVNNTGKSLVISGRHGCPVIVPAIGHRTQVLEVVVTHILSRSEMSDGLVYMEERCDQDDPEIKAWMKAYYWALSQESRNPKSSDMLRAAIQYELTTQDLEAANGRAYMPDVDLLVEFREDRGAVHPFSSPKRTEATIDSLMPKAGTSSFTLMIKSVDNSTHGNHGTRYINVGGKVYCIPVEKDMTYTSGVHIISRQPIINGEVRPGVGHRILTVEEADAEFNLQKTTESAIEGGSSTEMVKLRLETELIDKKIKESELKAQCLSMENELQLSRNDGARLKVELDKESALKKNFMEWPRILTGLLVAATSIIGLFAKAKKKAFW